MASLSASLKVTRSPPSLGTRAPGSCSAAGSTRSARSETATSSLSEVCSVRTRTATPSVQPTLEISQIGNSYFLTVRSVFGEDEDSYTIRATNSGGSKSSKAELKIKQPPRLNVPPRFRDSAFFDKGENA